VAVKLEVFRTGNKYLIRWRRMGLWLFAYLYVYRTIAHRQFSKSFLQGNHGTSFSYNWNTTKHSLVPIVVGYPAMW